MEFLLKIAVFGSNEYSQVTAVSHVF